ncbi:MAG: hypothetical protein DWQ56_05610 [Microcystis aeruginosa DA14]|jgi:hypothetical protein|uniref:Uncharacterized protein n=1 Tax=Microcystis aeruginosa DA14 TaxID=1987506 RepID=A0A3E0MLJ0_MICAE|nr:MAG: hypothetical protein DWQ56_05610 [Microcystis aeruginosa DA14]
MTKSQVAIYQLSVISYQLSDVSFQFTVYCLLFTGRLRRAFGNTEKLPTPHTPINAVLTYDWLGT